MDSRNTRGISRGVLLIVVAKLLEHLVAHPAVLIPVLIDFEGESVEAARATVNLGRAWVGVFSLALVCLLVLGVWTATTQTRRQETHGTLRKTLRALACVFGVFLLAHTVFGFYRGDWRLSAMDLAKHGAWLSLAVVGVAHVRRLFHSIGRADLASRAKTVGTAYVLLLALQLGWFSFLKVVLGEPDTNNLHSALARAVPTVALYVMLLGVGVLFMRLLWKLRQAALASEIS